MSKGPIVVRLPTTLLKLVPGLDKEGLTLGIWTHFSGEKCPPGRFSELSGAAGFEACNETGVAVAETQQFSLCFSSSKYIYEVLFRFNETLSTGFHVYNTRPSTHRFVLTSKAGIGGIHKDFGASQECPAGRWSAIFGAKKCDGCPAGRVSQSIGAAQCGRF